MEAKELMIGDWVNIIPEEYRDENYNIQIDRIQPKMSNRLRVGAGKYYSHINLITPIPLTEEILKANGFKNVLGYDYYYSTEQLRQEGLVVTINDEMLVSVWQDHNDNNYVEFSCAFVHELQHALRLCGLDGLADNFKIE